MTIEKKKIRCAIYVRKLREDGPDPESISIGNQRVAGEMYIKTNENWEIVSKYYGDDDCSDKNDKNIDRPGLQELFKDIEDDLIDYVVLYKTECLTRSALTLATIIEMFEQSGVVLVSMPQSFSTGTPMGKLILKTLSSLTQYEEELKESWEEELEAQGWEEYGDDDEETKEKGE